VQQQSLASAVFAYAANIGNPGALGPVVKRIVHKHVSVGIRAEHYPIVGHHLLGDRRDPGRRRHRAAAGRLEGSL
jgi:nitric oxide dioxygenase